MPIRTFQAKLLYLLIAVLLLLEAATLLSVHFAGKTALRRSIGEELKVGGNVLRVVLSNRADQLRGGLRVVALDFPFRQAVAEADLPTIEDVLANHGARIGADALVLIGLDGNVMADTFTAGARAGDVPVAPLLAMAQQRGGEAFATFWIKRRHAISISYSPLWERFDTASGFGGAPLKRYFVAHLFTLSATLRPPAVSDR